MRIDRRGENDAELSPYAYYRRITDPRTTGLSLYDTLLNAWSNDGSLLGNAQDVDWRAFDSETDAMDDVNPWADCSYTASSNRGFPGDCGPGGPATMKWVSRDGCSASASPGVAIYIYAPANSANMRPSKFRGLSSRLAPSHGQLLDGEGLDIVTAIVDCQDNRGSVATRARRTE